MSDCPDHRTGVEFPDVWWLPRCSTWTGRWQYSCTCEVPNGYCPIYATGVKLPEGFAVTPLQYVD